MGSTKLETKVPFTWKNVANADNPKNASVQLLDLAEELQHLFLWERAPQGHEFWKKAYDELTALAREVYQTGEANKEDDCRTIILDGKKYKLVETE